MRKIISWEGAEKVPNIVFEPGALQWDEGQIPVIWSFIHNDPKMLLGHARDLRREADGSVTAEIVFDDTEQGGHAKTVAGHGDVAFTTWSDEVISKQDQGKKLVHSAKIRSISAVLSETVGWK